MTEDDSREYRDRIEIMRSQPYPPNPRMYDSDVDYTTDLAAWDDSREPLNEEGEEWMV